MQRNAHMKALRHHQRQQDYVSITTSQHMHTDKVAVPCLFDAEGIRTMPVSLYTLVDHCSSCPGTDFTRSPDAAVLPVSNVVTLCGSFPARPVHSVVRLSIDPVLEWFVLWKIVMRQR